ncbi:hypothetical protein ACJIZ3_008080 [Penstemon smallii]|uniref:Protein DETOXIFICATION n=1 Tax=Penstemon smallii TaxID=265156 RepID=A0ABD3T8S1_9LAMI
MALTTSSPPLLVNINIPKFRINEQESSKFHHGSLPSLTLSEVIVEIKMLYTIALPMIITGLLIYGKSLVSMLFLGRLGKDALAGGSLAIGIANITGYSVISGLAMGMEAISSQAFGAKKWPLMSQTLQRTIIILLLACIPISLLWLNIEPILIFCNQDPTISSIASTYLTFCLPDLIFQSLINPLKIYLRSQNITLPIIFSAAFALSLHAPINYFLTNHTSLGIQGIALAVAITDFNLLAALTAYACFAGIHREYWLGGWGAIQCCCCFSVCLEWWWYELMILLSGTLSNAAEAVATMGILLQATSLVYIFPSALSLAVSTRVGNELGANQPSNARASSFIALFCAILTSLIAVLFMVMFGDTWAGAFTEDKAILGLSATLMPVVGLCELGNCPQTAGCGVLRGSARPSLGVHINLGSFYGVGLPLAVFLGFGLKLGLLGLWLGLLVAQVVCAILMFWAFRRTDWVDEAKRARELIGVEMEDEGELNEGLIPIKTVNQYFKSDSAAV